MKQSFSISLLLILAFLACDTTLMAQKPEDLMFKTFSGGANKCYGRAMIYPQFDTIEEKIIVRPSYSFLKEIPAVYNNVTERILIQPAYTRVEVVPAEFETVTERIQVKKAESYQKSEAPPTEKDLFKDQVVTVELSPAYQIWEKTKRKKNCRSKKPEDCLEWQLVDIPAKKVQVIKKVRSGNQLPTTSLPTVYKDAEFVTVTKKILKKEASFKEVKIPAQYQTVTKKILVDTRKFVREQVPAEYKTVKKIIPIKDGGFMEAREVVCRSDYPNYIRKLQMKLRDLNYYQDEIDGRFGKDTKNAVINYQKDNKLPVGQLDFETLKRLELVK